MVKQISSDPQSCQKLQNLKREWWNKSVGNGCGGGNDEVMVLASGKTRLGGGEKEN